MSTRGMWTIRMYRSIRVAVLAGFAVVGVACQGCEESIDDPRGDASLADVGGPDSGDDGESEDTGIVEDDSSAPEPDTAADTGETSVDASCPGPICGATCCAASEECVDGQCLAACSGTRCGSNKTKCCTGDELCLGGGCVIPGKDCDRTEECAVDEICEQTVGKCVPRSSVEVCEYRPPVGQFQPEVACNWTPDSDDPKPERGETEAAPTVINVTDDNGDGTVDENDIPEIVFLSDDHSDGCCNNPSTIRIVSGKCNSDGSMETLGSISSPVTESSGGLAVGDLTGNGVPEIVGITKAGSGDEEGTAAWTQKKPYDGSDWELLWHNQDYPTHGKHTTGGAVISIADLEADGTPDIIVGNVALNGETGKLKWDGYAKTNGNGGVGNNAFLGPASAVADVDLDGKREVAAGNTLYDFDGTPLWTYNYQSSNSICQGGPCDGFNGFGDFDQDPEGEIVVVRRGIVYILNHDGSLEWKQEILKDDCRENESGPPTVADFDGDSEPEIGTAAADFYTVLDPECDQDPVPSKCKQKGILWATPNEDCSSRVTASSVFDFEGDGKAEMVYADEDNFYIMDGTNGDILFKDTDHSSNTRIEMPLVADSDNDGNSEVVVPAPSGPNKGITIWADKDDNWVRTRRIWNQHGYSVTNVEEDGTIPTQPEPNWTNGRLNNWRQNQQPAGVFDAPDLQVTDIALTGIGCVGSDKANVEVTVKNDGALGVPPGQPVVVSAVFQGTSQSIGQKSTQSRLLPGQTETLVLQWEIPDGWRSQGFELKAEIDPKNNVNECKEMNNTLTVQSKDVIQVKPPPLEVTSLSTNSVMCGQTGKIQVDLTVENTSSNQIVPRGVPIVLESKRNGTVYSTETVNTSKQLSPGDSESFTVNWDVDSSLVSKKFDITAEIDPNQDVLDCKSGQDTTAAECDVAG